MENWKTIDDNPGYEVSNIGRVRNKGTGRVLTPHLNNGYERVRVGGKLYYVNRLVAEAFSNQGEYEDHATTARIVRCKDCVHRYEFDICEDKDDYFYCSYGE